MSGSVSSVSFDFETHTSFLADLDAPPQGYVPFLEESRNTILKQKRKTKKMVRDLGRCVWYSMSDRLRFLNRPSLGNEPNTNEPISSTFSQSIGQRRCFVAFGKNRIAIAEAYCRLSMRAQPWSQSTSDCSNETGSTIGFLPTMSSITHIHQARHCFSKLQDNPRPMAFDSSIWDTENRSTSRSLPTEFALYRKGFSPLRRPNGITTNADIMLASH